MNVVLWIYDELHSIDKAPPSKSDLLLMNVQLSISIFVLLKWIAPPIPPQLSNISLEVLFKKMQFIIWILSPEKTNPAPPVSNPLIILLMKLQFSILLAIFPMKRLGQKTSGGL